MQTVPSKHTQSLGVLPAELQCAIFRLLDPISLIFISQTSSQLRDLIKPTRDHWAEFLLAQECLEEVGGKIPVFCARKNQCEPDWTSPEWQSMRWACTGCLRLLPHSAFDNHYLLRLRYRKPIPGSPASRLYTSWKPPRTGRANKTQKQQRKPLKLTPEEREIRKRYGIATTHNYNRRKSSQDPGERLATFQDCGMEMFTNMTLPEFIALAPEEEEFLFDQEATLIELARCGFNRRLRICNECRYQKRQLKPDRFGKGGTRKVPIVAGRRLALPNALDRFLPGISDLFDSVRPANAPVFLIWRQDTFHRVWTEWMVRCPGCEQWKESRKFMLGSFWNHWQPTSPTPESWYHDDGFMNWSWTRVTESFLDDLRCGPCYVRERGRDAFREEFMRFLRWILRVLFFDLDSNLAFGWRHLGSVSYWCPKSHKKEVRKLLDGPRKAMRRPESDTREGLELTHQEIAVFRLYRGQWMELRERLYLENKSEWMLEEDWFSTWNLHYDLMEANWMWLKAIEAQVEEKCEILVDWALESTSQLG